jgi:hypothetical protein
MSSPSVWTLSSIAFFGRSFDEYAAMFGLDPASLAGRAVADVGSGPSSFVADATGRGIHAVGVDPLYGLPADTLAAHVQIDYERMFAQMRAKPELFRFRHFPSIEAAEADRRAAARRFLADYEWGFPQGRYVGAGLPRLPFPDKSFDVTLCGHLLFLYAQQHDFAWHVAACRELVRLSRDEVRIRPLCGLDGVPSPLLADLRTTLRAYAVAAEIVQVDYSFFAGSEQVLVLRSEAAGAQLT